MRFFRSYAAAAAAIALSTTADVAAPLAAGSFAYNAAAPLKVRAAPPLVRGGIRSTLLTFDSQGRTIHAEIVAPVRAKLRHAGVLFVHWLGDAPTTNHTEFEPDARALAKRGATCLLIDAQWSTVTTAGKDWFTKVRTTESDYDNSIAQVIDLRRALDLLVAQLGVDPARIAYVAHDFGAMYGAVLSGVDPRPRYYLLMAGTTTFSEWFLLGAQPADAAAYVSRMSPLDPLPYLSRSKAQGFMFQFAAHDRYVTAQHATEFFEAAPLPRAMFLYDAQHDLKVAAAFRDRLAWLTTRLF